LLLVLAGLGLTIAGQVTDWGVIGEGERDWRLTLDVLDPHTSMVRRSTVPVPNWPRGDGPTMIPGSTAAGAAFGANGIVISTD
jgi:hypothetical protein